MLGAWYIISPLSEKVEGTCPPCLPPNCAHDCNVIQTPQCDVMYAFLSVSGIIALATRCAIKKLEGMQHSNAETNTAQNALATRTTKILFNSTRVTTQNYGDTCRQGVQRTRTR